jgi:ribonucleoside-diphosphate reductase alpha chain
MNDKTDMATADLLTAERAMGDLLSVAAAAASSPKQPEDTKRVDVRRFEIKTDPSRDALLTDFGKETLDDRYLLPGETYQDLFARVADAYADDAEHAQRIYDYISKLWFMPATPVLSNGGTGRGLPISCYLNTVEDSLDGIVSTWTENVWLASRGAASAPIGARCAGLANRSA